jgi:hypothetical protein
VIGFAAFVSGIFAEVAGLPQPETAPTVHEFQARQLAVALDGDSAGVADQRRVAAEADRLVEPARGVRRAVDDRLAAPFLVQAP